MTDRMDDQNLISKKDLLSKYGISYGALYRWKRMGLIPLWYREIPLRSFLSPLARLPILKEMFVKMCACVIEKP